MSLIRSTLFLIITIRAFAQDSDKATLSFADSNGPKTLFVSVFFGNITVKTHIGKDVVAEVHARGASRNEADRTRLNVKQSGNEIRLFLLPQDQADLTVEVPVDTALRLDVASRGEVSVEDVTGDIEVNNIHGRIRLLRVRGAIKALSMSGSLTVGMSHIPIRPLSLTAFDGNVDLAVPASTQANVSMKSSSGPIVADFDIVSRPGLPFQGTPQEDTPDFQFDRALVGTINGGGPKIQIAAGNGAVHLRRLNESPRESAK